MKRYYLSPIIGDGQSPETSYRPKLADIPGISYVSEMKTDSIGKPMLNWALCLVSGNKHGLLISDPSIKALPDVSLDVKMNAINNVTRARFISDTASFGIDTAFINSADGYRDSIRGLGMLLNPVFNENNFDISE